MKRLTQILIMALAAITTQLASAVNYSPNDLLLVFHQSGFSDVIYDIGSVTNYSGVSAGTVVNVSYDKNLVKANFGGTLSGVEFGVVGEKDSAAKIWLSDVDLVDAPGAITPNTYATLQSKINGVGVNAALITSNNASPLIIDPSDANSYSYIVSPGDAGNIDTMGGDAPFAVSEANPAQEVFYEMMPNSAPTFLGTFKMTSDGTIVFTAGISPLITSFSGSSVTARGSNATFSVTALNATGYQWYLNGVAIADATNSTLVVSNAQPGNSGGYTVVVSNSVDSTSTASLTTIHLGVTGYLPTDLLMVFHDGINPDMEFNLGAVSNYLNQAVGTKTVTYDQSLALSNFGSLAGVSAYFVAELDSASKVWLSDADLSSTPSYVTLNTYATLEGKINNVGSTAGSSGFPLTIGYADANSYSSIVSPGDSANVASMSGDAPFTVGSAAPSAVGFYELHPTVSNPPPLASLSGVFKLATNGDVIFITMSTSSVPTITTQPAPTLSTNLQGSSRTYTVVATNDFTGGSDLALSYQWRLNGTNISGATSSSYTDSDLQPADAGVYSVVVSSIIGSTTSSNATLVITLDSVPPTVKIVTPVGYTTNTVATVTGTAKDTGSKIIKKVFYGFNGHPVTSVASFTGGSGTTTNWSINATLPAGTNYVVVRSQDLADNLSTPATNTFFYGVAKTLTLNIVGNGSVVPNGSATYGAVPAAAGPVSTNTVLIVGKTYTLKIVQTDTNFIYSNIVSSAIAPSTLTTYPFTMPSNNLTLTVSFVTNRFLAVVGSYNGLFWDTNNGVAFPSAGFANVKVSAKSYKLATYSATLNVAGTKLKVKGTFGLDGNTLPDTNGASLSLPFDGSKVITGSLTFGTNVSQLSADLAQTVTNYDGRYTLIVPGSTNGPAGDGYGLVLITNGAIKLTGSSLADGMAISQSVPVSQDGEWPLYVAGYKDAGKTNQAFMLGWVAVSTNGLSGTNYWIKTGAAGGTVYPAGFTNTPVIQGSVYNPAAASALELTTGVVIVQDGGLTTSTNTVSLAGFVFTPSLTNTAGVTNKMTLKIVTATGKLTGGFKTNGVTNTKFVGAVLQNSTNGLGYFINGSQSGSVTVQP